MAMYGYSSKKSDNNSIRFFQMDTPPVGAKLGDRWLNITNMTEFIYLKIDENPDVYRWIDLTGDYPGVQSLTNGDII
jgi:hypothetical protein